MYQKKTPPEIAIKTSEQMAVYDGKLRKPERIKRENLKKKKNTYSIESNTERQFHNVVYK